MEYLLHRVQYSYGGREGGREGGKEGGREGGREGGKKGEREGGREGEREGAHTMYLDCIIEGPVVQILCHVYTQCAKSICHWLKKETQIC